MPRLLQPFSPIRQCPFCGGKSDLFKDEEEKEDYFEPIEIFVRCLEGGAKGPFAFTQEEACAHWNRRYTISERQIKRERETLEPPKKTLDDLSNDELAVHLSEVGGLFD